MNETVLTFYVLGKVEGAEKRVKEGYAPGEQEFLNRLGEYFSYLRKKPDNFEGREGFLSDFKKYFAKPCQLAIEKFEQDIGAFYAEERKQVFSYSLKMVAGAGAAFFSFVGAVFLNPAFWILTAGGIGYAVYEGISIKGMVNESDESIDKLRIDQKDIEKTKEELENIEPKTLDNLLINNEGEITKILE